MNFFKLYARVLSLLGPEARLGFLLAGANLALAVAQFAEPVLFGRIIDTLVRAQAASTPPSISTLSPLLAAWVWQLRGQYDVLQVLLLVLAGVSAASFVLAARLRPQRATPFPANA
jgi:hypothetical protein